MQKMPCDVLAYRKFSIFLLQFRHRKHVAQKAWSPVKIARSSILFPHALQLYVQLLHMSEPSPRRRRFASESRRVPQVLQRKQLRCQRLPAAARSAKGSGEYDKIIGKLSLVKQQHSAVGVCVGVCGCVGVLSKTKTGGNKFPAGSKETEEGKEGVAE